MLKPYTLHSLRKRILTLLVLISFLFCSLVIRLFVVQIINGKSLQLKATDQWTRDIQIIAPRGNIYDKTGSTLATSYTTYNIYTRPREILDSSNVSLFLSKTLEMDFNSVYEKVSKKGISETLIKMQVDSETATKIYNENLNGIYLAENCNRYYPYGDLLTQILGFVSYDNHGQSGIEAYFDNYLFGINGYSFTQSDLQGSEIGGSLRYYVNSQKGSDLTLTIDSKIQLILEQTLSQIMTEQLAKNATGIIMDVQSGEILAMSTKPSFNLNEIPRDDLETLFSESKIKAITDIYEPGSTFKILTLAAALEEGVVSLDDHFYCPGYRVIDGVRIKCWKSHGHGSQTLAEGFANSCNCVFMDLALRLGVDKFYEYVKKFGVGSKTGISLGGEVSGILMDKKYVKTVDLARMGFGHAITVTPLQLLTAVCGILGNGTLKTPYILSSVSGNQNQNFSTTIKRQILSQETSKIMNELMEKATNKAGKNTFLEGYNVGGKTGTAQKYDENGAIAQGKYISSFIGTYPANEPKYALIVMVDEASAGAYYGSIVAAPYGKIIFQKMFEYLGIKKDDENVKLEYIEMPDITDLPLTTALETLIKMGINYEIDGDGGFVKKQLPPAGTILAVGDTIVVVT